MLDAPEKYSLRKTATEKYFLKNINALEQSFGEEKDSLLKEAYSSQIKGLKGSLASLSPAQHTFAQSGHIGPKSINVYSSHTPLRQHPSGIGSGRQKSGSPQQQSAGREGLIALYRAVLRRYAELISERERKTVGEIKALVTKNDLTIQSLAQGFIAAQGPSAEGSRPEGRGSEGTGTGSLGRGGEKGAFPKGYAKAGEKAFNYVRDQIKNLEGADIGISFWLTPTEIVSERIADDEDKAILLCSILYALGDEKAEVVIAELENNTPHAFVATELDGRFLLLDPSQQSGFLQYHGLKSDIMGKYSFNGSAIRKFLYKFNNANYEQF